MLFSLAVAFMIILVSAFWAYQGFFSSLIMFFEAVIACMLAFLFYEGLAGVWSESIGVGLGEALAFILILLGSLAVLRTLTDKLVGGNVRFPLYVDRAAGGVCGFFTGMVLIGGALIGVQMVPLGSSVFGFERISVSPEGTVTKRSLFFKPDEFTVGLMNMLSIGRFAPGESPNPLAVAKPEFLVDLCAARSLTATNDRYAVPADCLKVTAWWEGRQLDAVTQRPEGLNLLREFNTQEVSDLNKLLVCRVRLDAKAATAERQDIRFRVPQFRVVGPPPGAEGRVRRSPSSIPACGLSDIYTHKGYNLKTVTAEQAQRLVRFAPETDLILSPSETAAIAEGSGSGEGRIINAYVFDVAFEVPADLEPWYIEFKRGGRAELTRKTRLEEPPKPPEKPRRRRPRRTQTEKEEGGGKVEVGEAPSGRLHMANAVKERTGVSDLLPLVLDRQESVVSQAVSGRELSEGHFFIELKQDEVPEDRQVKKFHVPEGKKMVQVGAEQVMAESLYGRALSYASATAAKIKLTTQDGTDYYAQGVYSLADVGGATFFEIQYWPEAEVTDRCLQPAKKLTQRIMSQAKPQERRFGYVFLVDPGVKIVSFSAGGRVGTSQKVEIDVPE